MLVLDMSQRLQQNLLTHFLQNRGFSIRDRSTDHFVDWSSITLLTDKLPSPKAELFCKYQIWLLDKQGPMPVHVPIHVKGLLLSDCDLNELETCIGQVIHDQSYLSPGLIQLLNKQPFTDNSENTAKLTSREQQVFELIKAGLSVRDIAERLFISPHTAENHRANIQRKMALTGRLSLVRYAASVQNPGK